MSGAPGGDGAGLVRLGIRVRGDRAEIALAALLPLLGGGAEETDPRDGTVEYALYAPPDALPSPAAVRGLAGDAVLDVAVSDVPAGWERRWHAHLRPVEVAAGARRVRVRPPWMPPAADGAALDVVVDPGDSFGAGGHATTQLCLELLLELEPDGALCDWGAGSGVLALAAARLGWDPVHAVELDPRAVATIRANADANGLDVHAQQLDLTAAAAPWAPSVCANLTLELLSAAAARAAPRPPGRMIASGVVEPQADAAAAALAGLGLRETRRRVRDGWAALRLERA
jgi:ribosomal protein L11 methyltransferase